MGESVRDSDGMLSAGKINWYNETQSHVTHKAIRRKALITLSVIVLEAILIQLDIKIFSSCIIL